MTRLHSDVPSGCSPATNANDRGNGGEISVSQYAPCGGHDVQD